MVLTAAVRTCEISFPSTGTHQYSIQSDASVGKHINVADSSETSLPPPIAPFG
jgi:hypothetical protein